MTEEAISTRTEGPVLVLTINRPEAMNSLDVPAMQAFGAALEEFQLREDLRVAIITGAGDRAFCTGSDLKNTPPPEASFAEAYFQNREVSIANGLYVRAVSIGDMGLTKPLIAAINGYALGGGLEIALDCDMRIASNTASFGLPEARWASVPGICGVSQLLRAIPRAAAMQMLLTGDRISAEEALAFGLVSELLAPEELLERAVEIGQRISSNGPLAVASIKVLAQRTEELTLRQSVAMEQMLWGMLRDTEDRVEGRRAFAEKRVADYLGR